MSRLFRKIGLIFTSFLLIAATGGYSIYNHYCDCRDVKTTSVFMEMECDAHHALPDEPSCCTGKNQEMSCCSTSETQDTEHNCNDGNCCHTNIEFLKINDSYTPGQAKVSLEVFTAALTLFAREILFENILVEEPCRNLFTDTSPPVTGKKLLLHIHQLKLSPPELV